MRTNRLFLAEVALKKLERRGYTLRPHDTVYMWHCYDVHGCEGVRIETRNDQPGGIAVEVSKVLDVISAWDPAWDWEYQEQPHTLEENMEELNKIGGLKAGWFDGNKSELPAYSIELISKVAGVLRTLPVQPAVFPTGRNSIQLEFMTSKGDFLEFELFEGGKIRKLYSGDYLSKDYLTYVPVETIEEITKTVSKIFVVEGP